MQPFFMRCLNREGIYISKKESYKTVSKFGRDSFSEKKSNFIASVSPVETEDAAIEFINKIRSEYHDARHNVYAYVIDENNISRYSDDGEPQGSAGIPVLNVIQKENLTNVVVVVTRYFGGILLGTGGLARAYGQSAKLGIDAAAVTQKTLCDIVSIESDYNLAGKIQYKTAAAGYSPEETVYSENVVFTVCIRRSDTQKFINEITNITNARAVCSIIGEKYADSPKSV